MTDLDSAALADRTARVLADVADAAAAAGRNAGEVTTIVVTKFHPAELVRALAELGQRHLGESRLQEFAPKAQSLRDLDLDWHFIGQLQSKKAARALEHAGTIHSLDRRSLLTALAASGRAADVFIQVNLTDDPARGGVSAADLPEFAEAVLAVPALRLRGLMAVAGLGAEPRAEFARVRELRDRLLTPIAPAATALSMGMSGDYRDAIAEGATHLRIGTAITGKRPDPAYARS
ncbi:MAG TPA: YggS family pyridoxal phosphate-dependent enzyme [Microbacteriaceae bacterium]|nr:YggS family pyridoxal phosphate-dependent enzyme [Microbacteriaceae bacterium]